MSIDLEQVVLDGGTRFVNFFEGRILTGRDLRDEQTAGRQDRGALGRAIGWGVVNGLEVTNATPSGAGSTPAVRVGAGLAVARGGQALCLGTARTVRLAELAEDDPSRGGDLFGACGDQPASSGAPTAEGFHILTLAPATGYEEEAPKSGLGDPGTASGCGRRYVTQGLRFRLQRFDPALLAGDGAGAEIATLALASGDPALSRLRNRVAHLGLGSAERAGFPLAPFATGESGLSAWAEYGLEALLSAGETPLLMACEVPLAVLRLRGGQIAYVDMWTLRRRIRTRPQAAAWPLVAATARQATDAATLFQFQDHLAWLFGRISAPTAAQAVDHFRYLPPVGFLPLGAPEPFLPNAQPPLPLAPGRVIPLVEAALAYPAVDLAASPGFLTYRVEGTDNWILFTSDIVPSAELDAQKCTALEERIRILEETLAAPGTIAGVATFTYDLSAGSISQPFVGITIRASVDGETAGEAITGTDGRYTLSLPPGTYDLVPVYTGNEITRRRVQGVEVLRGATITRNFDIRFQDLISVGGLR